MAGSAHAGLAQFSTAGHALEKALRMDPTLFEVYDTLARIRSSQGNTTGAIQVYRRALELRPDDAATHYHIATLLDSAAERLAHLDRACELVPETPQHHFARGNALFDLGRHADAAVAYETALAQREDYLNARHNHGNALKMMGRLDEARRDYEAAAAGDPSSALFALSLAGIYCQLHLWEECEAQSLQTLALNPGSYLARLSLASSFYFRQDLDRALGHYERAVALSPTEPEGYYHLGNCLMDMRRWKDAVDAFSRALKFNPRDVGSLTSRYFAKTHLCDWDGRENDTAIVLAHVKEQLANADAQLDVKPFYALLLPFEPQLFLGIVSHASKLVEHYVASWERAPFSYPPRAQGAPLRVGYLSGDFGGHPVGRLVRSVFGLHDRGRVAATCYTLTPDDDSDVRKAISEGCQSFVDLSALSALDAASRINSDGIDVLVDLHGHTSGGRIEVLALRPAPVQATYLGYAGSTGASFIDYLVTDAVASPDPTHYSERLVYMPGPFMVTDHMQSHPDLLHSPKMERNAYGLPSDKFIFCNFNQLFKIDTETWEAWMDILTRVPDSVLWLQELPANGAPNLRREATKRGVDASRLIFTGRYPWEKHLAIKSMCDLFLDTHAYNAHTSAADALWAGIPVLIHPGDSMAARVSLSLLSAVNCPGLVTTSFEEYGSRAVALASDQDELSQVRACISAARHTSPLFDTAQWTRYFERALYAMWEARDERAQRVPLFVHAETSEECLINGDVADQCR